MQIKSLLSIAPVAIAVLALVVSFISLLFTARTYGVTNRPYVGIVDTPFQLVENPPRAVLWKLVLKNVGELPGFVRIEENTALLTTSAGTTRLASLGAIGKTGSLLMPGQTIELLGQYTEVGGPVPMADILAGRATLDVAVKVNYEFPGWFGKSMRTYGAQVRFHSLPGVAPGFSMVSANAD